MLLSSCVVWRLPRPRRCSASSARAATRTCSGDLSASTMALAWLRALGAEVVWEETGNPLTVGLRFDPRSLTDVLVGRRARSGSARPRPATRSSSCSRPAASRATATSSREHIHPAASCSFAPTAGARATGYGSRSRAARRSRRDGRVLRPRDAGAAGGRPRGALRRRWRSSTGGTRSCSTSAASEFAPDPISWSETDLVQAIAQRPNASAWYLVDEEALGAELRGRTVRDMIEAAREAGERCCCRTSSAIEVPAALPLCRARRRRDHAHDRRRAHRQAGACAPRGRHSDRGPLRGGRRRRRHRDGRVRERLASALVFGRLAAETGAPRA